MQYIGTAISGNIFFVRVFSSKERLPGVHAEAVTLNGSMVSGELLGRDEVKGVLADPLTIRFIGKAAGNRLSDNSVDFVFSFGDTPCTSVVVYCGDVAIAPLSRQSSLESLLPKSRPELKLFSGITRQHFDKRTVAYTAGNILKALPHLAECGLQGYYVNAAVTLLYKHAELSKFDLNVDSMRSECQDVINRLIEPQETLGERRGSSRENSKNLRSSLDTAVINYLVAARQYVRALEMADEVVRAAKTDTFYRQNQYYNPIKVALYAGICSFMMGERAQSTIYCGDVIYLFYASTRFRTDNLIWFAELKHHHNAAYLALQLRSYLEGKAELKSSFIQEALKVALRVPVSDTLSEEMVLSINDLRGS